MSTWYADADVGSSGDGTSWALAKKTLVEVAALIGNGDTVNLRGTFRQPDYLAIASKSNVRIVGDGTAWIRGDRILASGSWTNEGGGVYSQNIGANQTFGGKSLGVVEDWDTRIDGSGRHYGHLSPVTPGSDHAATVALVAAAANGSWSSFSDGSNGKVYVKPSDGGNPGSNGKVYGWCSSSDTEATGGNGIILTTCTDCTVSNVTCALIMRMDGAQGYGVRLADCRRCVVEDCVVWDGGYHAVGAAKSFADECIIRRCTAWGGFSDGSQIVNPFVFASTADASGDG